MANRAPCIGAFFSPVRSTAMRKKMQKGTRKTQTECLLPRPSRAQEFRGPKRTHNSSLCSPSRYVHKGALRDGTELHKKAHDVLASRRRRPHRLPKHDFSQIRKTKKRQSTCVITLFFILFSVREKSDGASARPGLFVGNCWWNTRVLASSSKQRIRDVRGPRPRSR